MNTHRGFTLLEILVVVGIIGLLIAIIIPSLTNARVRQRNAERATEVALILNAVYQYAVDTNNQIPTVIPTTATEICRTGASSCSGLVDLSVLTTNQKYMSAIPSDPQNTSANGVGYTIVKNSNGRVTIAAPRAEGGATIAITR